MCVCVCVQGKCVLNYADLVGPVTSHNLFTQFTQVCVCVCVRVRVCVVKDAVFCVEQYQVTAASRGTQAMRVVCVCVCCVQGKGTVRYGAAAGK
jgi:hypothetical protein